MYTRSRRNLMITVLSDSIGIIKEETYKVIHNNNKLIFAFKIAQNSFDKSMSTL